MTDLPLPSADSAATLTDAILRWYDTAGRDLPWRHANVTPWQVLVSEFMLQQTPVSRVLPAYAAWLERWPTALALANTSPGDAVRQWDRLGYPRRALWLHAAAVGVRDRFGGRVPETYEQLRTLTGVGDYTASAVLSFAFGQRRIVLDTNVRRVLARLIAGNEAPSPARTVAEDALAERLLPTEAPVAARWAAASMELGALVCTARKPDCSRCPVADACAWRRAGYPASVMARRRQTYAGTDRQARGMMLGLLRAREGAVHTGELLAMWPDRAQARRALVTLTADGLATPIDEAGRPQEASKLGGQDELADAYSLPGGK